MRVWALVSQGCRESIELYLDEETARAELRDAVTDEPDWIELLDVVEVDLGVSWPAALHPCLK